MTVSLCTMAPRKVGKNGKQPVKRKAPEVSPPHRDESSDEEGVIPDYEAMIHTLSELEQVRLLAREHDARVTSARS